MYRRLPVAVGGVWIIHFCRRTTESGSRKDVRQYFGFGNIKAEDYISCSSDPHTYKKVYTMVEGDLEFPKA
jgi:hypothetical protein